MKDLPRPQLEQRLAELTLELSREADRGLKLDMTRGKPSAEQLDLSLPLLSMPGEKNFRSGDGTDLRNYGGLEGLKEARQLMATLLDAPAEQVIIGGNSSLQLMHDTLVRALLFGVPGGTPWRAPLKFLCPVPGYDRHFALCETLGIEMLPVRLLDNGPDMNQVEDLIRDPAVKGIWCVPKYGNPTGSVYSREVVERLARMKTAAADFRIFWDNAYALHHLYFPGAIIGNILELCAQHGHPDRAIVFASTSKISFAGAGLSAMAGSESNVKHALKYMAFQTIGPDKINQWRHVQFFRDGAGLTEHMQKHAHILRPRFAAVERIFAAQLGGKGIARWTAPHGGYFVSLNVFPGTAKRVVALCAGAGVKLTPAGATFPYGKDPEDSNLRIAPTLPPLAEIEDAMKIVCLAVEMAATEKILAG
ncbi:MAG: aminotransferase class I/II-fold pyridoxal phosphate-dependent enzyme [Spirochaetales bacterium]|nr:aminotransferase class I/II-fold pyridoxal phosphate-dependent enzyme [Spirochaetales bacterium]